jgi:xanthine dehydrogenase YagR molybdenum-binding subunit
MGQGSKSVLQNMAHRALGLPAERIDVRVADSSLPTAPGSFGSITTSSIGPAARDAFRLLKEELLDAAEGKLGSLTAEERGARDARGNLHAWGALMAHLPSTSVTVTGRRTVDKGGYKILPGPLHRLPLPIAIGQDTVSSVMVAEVEVDRLLGRTRVLRMMTTIDAGLLMSPVTAYSQVMGGMIQGISYGLYEGRRMDRRTGRQLNRSLETYALLGMADAPAMEVHFLARPTVHTPHGGAGLGENATIAAAAAVANAFFHATGVRALRTPMTPASVLPLWT